MLYGSLEAGGTKMVLSVGNENNELLERVSLPTETPELTVPRIAEWFAARSVSALGDNSGALGALLLARQA